MSAYRKAVRFLGPEVAVYLALGTVAGVVMFTVELAFAYALQAFLVAAGIVDAHAVSLPAWMPHSELKTVLLFVLLVGVARGLMNWVQVYMPAAASEKFRHVLRSRVLRWSFHSESVSTHQAAMLFNEWANSSASLISAVQSAVVQATSALMLVAALLAISAKLTVIVAAALALLYPPTRLADLRIVETSKVISQSAMDTSRRMLTSIKNLLLIQIYGTQGLEEGKAQLDLELYGRKVLSYHGLSAFKYVLPQLVGVVLICVITVAARSYFLANPGVLVSYFYLVIRLLQLLSTINTSVSSVLRGWPETAIVWRWWEGQAHDRPGQPQAPAAPAPASSRNGTGPVGWELKGVRFAYPGTDEPVIKDLDLKLAPGQCLILTGPSGSGKSTILNLLLGCLKPDQGSVEVLLGHGERAPLQDFRSRLYDLIGYVGPESLLIEGTVRENLLYGLRREPSPDEIEAALAKAECAFVKDLGHRLTEQGQGLSAGQKQRLSLARAFLRKPRVLILDEATSNLDQETERRLVETLSKVKGEMTIVAATHRNALLSIADARVGLESQAEPECTQ